MKKSEYKRKIELLENQLFINDKITRNSEKHLQIAERELQAKERLIIDLKSFLVEIIKDS